MPTIAQINLNSLIAIHSPLQHRLQPHTGQRFEQEFITDDLVEILNNLPDDLRNGTLVR